MQRQLLIKVHLILAGFFLPFLIIMPLSGGLYLLGIKGQYTETLSFTAEETLPVESAPREQKIRDMLVQHNINFDFEYVKDKGDYLILRPSSRPHYKVELGTSAVDFYYLKPDPIKILVELHKGHGPQSFKTLEKLFALALLLIGLSGIWLAFGMKPYRPVFVGSLLVGSALFAWLAI